MSNNRSKASYVQTLASRLRKAQSLFDKASLFDRGHVHETLRAYPWSEHQSVGLLDLFLDLVSSKVFRAIKNNQELVRWRPFFPFSLLVLLGHEWRSHTDSYRIGNHQNSSPTHSYSVYSGTSQRHRAGFSPQATSQR